MQQQRILWVQVFALALVQGAIVLMWVIYNLYLGKLLGEFGFTSVFVTGILLLENGLAMLMEPLMGNYSDRAQRWLGSRFPFIAAGVILASGLLMATAVLVTFSQPEGIFRWLLPILLVAWAISMTLFRSPALSLLSRYAFGSGLPQAASVLTVMGAIAGAMGPLANKYILELGPGIAFSLASLILLGAAAILRSVNSEVKMPHQPSGVGARPSMRNLALVFTVGWGTSLGFRLLMTTFPKILKTIPDLNVGLTMGMIFIALGITAIPAGTVARKLGNRQAILLGLVGLALTLVVMNWVGQTWAALGVAIAIGTCLSLVNNGTLPFALSMVPAQKAGLGTGMFFSGGALSASLFGAFFKQPDALSPLVMTTVAIVSFVVAMIAIASSNKPSLPST